MVPVAGEDPYAWKGYETEGEYAYVRYRDRARVTRGTGTGASTG